MKKTLASNPKLAESLLSGYGLTGDLSDDDAAMLKVAQFASEIAFSAPSVEFARRFEGESYLAHFNVPNPWDGPVKGYPTHILDVAFIFQNFNMHLSAEEQRVAEQYAKDLIRFTNGKAPWKSLQSGTQGAGVYADGKREYKALGAEAGRDQKVYELGKDIGMDALQGVWEAFFFANP